MFDLPGIARNELNYQQKMGEFYQAELQNLPKGRLNVNIIKNQPYYFHVIDGERTYIGKKNGVVCDLQKRYFMEEALRRIDTNKKLLTQMQRRYQEITPEAICEGTPAAYRMSQEEYLLVNTMKHQECDADDYTKNTNYAHNLIHKTMKGDMVRSKSEVIIANALYMQGIDYHYEELVKIGRYLIAPDFRVWVESQQRYKYWEHMGMTGDPVYLDSALWKIRLYIENGYVLWEDVIFTFEDMNGNINAQTIEKIISEFCV